MPFDTHQCIAPMMCDYGIQATLLIWTGWTNLHGINFVGDCITTVGSPHRVNSIRPVHCRKFSQAKDRGMSISVRPLGLHHSTSQNEATKLLRHRFFWTILLCLISTNDPFAIVGWSEHERPPLGFFRGLSGTRT